MHFTWAIDIDIFWQGQTPVLMWPYSGSSVVSNISIILVSLLQYGSPSPISTETPEQKSLPAHHPSNIIVLPPGLSLARLVLSHFPFKSTSKLFQWVLLTPVQRLFSQFETGTPHLSPSGLVLCKLTHDQHPFSLKFCHWHQTLSQVFVCWLFLILLSSLSAIGRMEENTIVLLIP